MCRTASWALRLRPKLQSRCWPNAMVSEPPGAALAGRGRRVADGRDGAGGAALRCPLPPGPGPPH